MSRSMIALPVFMILQWLRDTASWSIWMSAFDDRPITICGRVRLNFLPSSSQKKTTKPASLATGRSLIYEIAVTTGLFRPVSLNPPLILTESADLVLRVRAIQPVIPRTLAQQRVDEA